MTRDHCWSFHCWWPAFHRAMSTMLVVLAAASKLDGRPWWKILMSGSSLTPGVPRYAVRARMLEAGTRMAYVPLSPAPRLGYVRHAGGRHAYPVRAARPRTLWLHGTAAALYGFTHQHGLAPKRREIATRSASSQRTSSHASFTFTSRWF